MTERFDDLTFLSDETIATAGLTGNRTQTLAQLYGLWTAFMVALIGGSGAPGVSASPTGNVLTTSVGTATASGATGVSASPSGNALHGFDRHSHRFDADADADHPVHGWRDSRRRLCR